MVKIAFCAVGAEGLGNISIYEEFGCLKNGMLDQPEGTVTQLAHSHRALLTREDRWL